MNPCRDWSIKTKLIGMIMCTTAVALLLASIALVSYDRFVTRSTMVQRLTVLSNAIGANSSAALLFNDPKAATVTLRALSAESHVVSSCLFDKDGSLFAFYYRTGTQPAEFPAAPSPEGDYWQNDHLVLFRNIVLDNESVGSLYIRSDRSELYSRLMRFLGIIVLIMVASLIGLEKVAQAIPSLILLDLMMPEMDGFEFVSRLRAHEQYRSIPIVVLTAMTLTPEEKRQLSEHVTRIAYKASTSWTSLMSELTNIVNGNPPQQPAVEAKQDAESVVNL